MKTVALIENQLLLLSHTSIFFYSKLIKFFYILLKKKSKEKFRILSLNNKRKLNKFLKKNNENVKKKQF